MRKPKIALVLSGGSALGFAHLGVLKELIADGIFPDIVVGTSMGAVIGGGYACGISVEEMIKHANQMKLTKFIDVNFKPMGVFGGNKITKMLSQVYGDKIVSDCICDFAAIACDIITGNEVVLNSGKVVDVVRASMNLPGILVPIPYKNMLLVDGGVVNNYPDDVAKKLGADIIIGVDVLKESYPNSKPKNVISAIFNSMHVAQNAITNYKPTCSDIMLTPNLKEIDQCSYKKSVVDKAVLEGCKVAREKMEEIKALISNWRENI